MRKTIKPKVHDINHSLTNSKGFWLDQIQTITVWFTAGLTTALFCWILSDLIIQGLTQISWSFLIESPRQAGRAGGIGPMIISTFLILLVCLAAAVPLGLATAILLAEFTTKKNRFGKLVRFSLDVLAGVPSIVFGLFGNAFFCIWLKLGFSILSGGLTLACMVLPILIRSLELSLRSLSNDLRFSGAALAMSRTSLLVYVLLPAAAPGLAAGLMLGMGRALSETAALIFTSGYVDRMPSSVFDSGRSLSIHIYDLTMNVPGGEPHAYGSALVLMLLLLLINVVSHWFIDRVLYQRIMS